MTNKTDRQAALDWLNGKQEMDGHIHRKTINNALSQDPTVLVEALEKANNHIDLILPMAKGYAHSHDVGMNKAYIEAAENQLWHAEKVLKQFKDMK